MGRNLSPALRQELAKLEKDADSRRSAMKALKLYVKDMDSKAIPIFLAQVSETKDTGSSPGEYTISIYEVLARVHGPNIVPQVDNIMSSIIKTLTASGGSFPLQQACSKVVPAIARYGIEPATPEDKKRRIIDLLCKPLTDALLGSQESLSCGAALCLKALVDCDNWRFASHEMVNEVCLKLAGALENKVAQTNSHMGLVMSLAKRNNLTVEAYARLLIRAGLNILNCGLSEKNSQKRLTSIQMVHSLMKCLDIRSIISELDSIIEEMENCQSDPMPYVKGAAFEALQTAKRLLVEKGSKIICDEVSMTGSNFSSSNSQRRNLSSPGSQSPLSVSPESQTLDLFAESFMESPISTSQASCNIDHVRNNINRKLRNQENGHVNVSLKDGLFSELAQESFRSLSSSELEESSDSRRSYANGFPGFVPGTPANGPLRSEPQSSSNGAFRRRAQSPGNGTLRSRPQSPSYEGTQDNSEDSSNFDNQSRRQRSPYSATCEWSQVDNQDGCLNKHKPNDSPDNLTDGCEDLQYSNSESVSSTEDVLAIANGNVSIKLIHRDRSTTEKIVRKSGWKISTFVSFIFLVVSVRFASVLLLDEQDEMLKMVPT